MTTLDENRIRELLSTIEDPHTGRDLVAEGALRSVEVEDGGVTLRLELGYPAAGWHEELERLVRERLQQAGAGTVTVEISTRIVAHEVQPGVKALPEVKNIIAVASGKGGVGKSTTAVNLALALKAEGAGVALLDADIYGPSIPTMLGVRGQPESPDGKSLLPLKGYGIQTISIGNLVDEESPMIWRGPMVTSALQQLLSDTRWEGVDYMIIDLPPGTGDIQLTLCQRIPVSGAVIVTTPQDIALLDARRALKMFEKVNVAVLGIIENMSTHVCSQCGHEEPIFGQGGGERMAQQYDVPLLGRLPLALEIREAADGGHPTVVRDPDSPAARSYREIARRLAGRLSLRARDFSARFPKIVVEND